MTRTFAGPAAKKPDTIPMKIRLAQYHELGQRYTLAAEQWKEIHDEVGDHVCLHRIWLLARAAQNIGRYDVAEAIYLMLFSKTKKTGYFRLAQAAGEKACEIFPRASQRN
jgi:hypothetical protein